jgi:ADP-heptose:LPS heptosyltransferase
MSDYKNFDYKNMVMILPERLGDTLFHTPTLRLFKQLKPDLKIDIIALSPLCATVLEHNPYVDAIHVTPSKAQTAAIARHCDIALNVHDHAVSRKYIERLNIKTLTAPAADIGKHTAQNALEFAGGLLGVDTETADKRYTLFPQSENFAKITRLLNAAGVDLQNEILIGCHIGCHSIAKRGWKIWKPLAHDKVWPFEKFVALEAELRRHDKRFRLILTGSKAEQALGAQFKKLAPAVVNLIDQTSVLDLAALMSYLQLYVTPDTGTLHAACATDVGIVALFAPTALQRTGPYPPQQNYRVLQAASIDAITVPQVVDAVLTHAAVANRLGAAPTT